MDAIRRLEAAIAQTRRVVAEVSSGQFSAPTGCTEWDVQALANHLLGVLVVFCDIADKGAADMALMGEDHVGIDLLGSYDRRALAAFAAWSAGDTAQGTANMPWGEMPADMAVQMLANDVLVHGWDLAQSTGQDVEWDQALAAESLEFAQLMFASPEAREGRFATSIPIGDNAEPMARLIAFLGRPS